MTQKRDGQSGGLAGIDPNVTYWLVAPLGVAKQAALSLGIDSTSLWYGIGRINTTLTKDVPSVGVLMMRRRKMMEVESTI